jgi:galactokinase
MTGGGFGGSCIALVKSSEAEAVMRAVGAAFSAKYGRYPASFVTPASAGARLVRL